MSDAFDPDRSLPDRIGSGDDEAALRGQQDYWDRMAQEKRFTLPFDAAAFSLRVPKTAPVLDVGCGYGRTLRELRAAGWTSLTGVDYAPRMIERGRLLCPELELSVGQGQELPFSDETFGAAILFAVLTGNFQDRDQERLIGEILRVLHPGGILMISDFLINEDERNLERYARFASKYGTYGIFELPDGGIVRHHSVEYIERLFSVFEVLDFHEAVFVTMNGNSARGFTCFGRKTDASRRSRGAG